MSTTTPRINSALVLQHIGQTVRIVGTVQGYDESKQHLSILASDGGEWTTRMALRSHAPARCFSMRPCRVDSCCQLCTCNRQPSLTIRASLLRCLLLCVCASAGSVIVIVAAQNVGVTWEAGQVLEIIGQAQGNAQPTITEYTSIPFAKNFGRSTRREAGQLSAGPFFRGSNFELRLLCLCAHTLPFRLLCCCWLSDMGNYEKLVQLVNTKYSALFH